MVNQASTPDRVAPVRERGLKYVLPTCRIPHRYLVAPVRERGLRLLMACCVWQAWGRSREGAWIEIGMPKEGACKEAGRSREGAWIEILV